MYTTDDRGVLNAYAKEAPIYFAQYPTIDEQRRYMLQGVLATLLVTVTVLIAIAVS
jgi:hypothetical protein